MNETLPRTEIHERFTRALDALVTTLKQDRTILATILCGSMAYDEVWEKSDIDLLLIGDETHKKRTVTLNEDGIPIHASIIPRSIFKKTIEGSLQSSFFHSLFSKSQLLYTHDDSLNGLYDNLQQIGARDRANQMMMVSAGVIYALPKAEKWFYVKHDLRYAYVYIMFCVQALAKIEMVSRGIITGREVIHQALKVNPEFFHRVYTDLTDGPKDEAAIQEALNLINAYMDERIPNIFLPILNYLENEEGPRSTTEIDDHFKNTIGEGASFACEWLADRGVIDKVSTPLRLSEKSRVAVNEAAYYYDGVRD